MVLRIAVSGADARTAARSIEDQLGHGDFRPSRHQCPAHSWSSSAWRSAVGPGDQPAETPQGNDRRLTTAGPLPLGAPLHDRRCG